MVQLQDVWIWDSSNLWQSDDLGVARQCNQLLILDRDWAVISNRRVAVISNNVDNAVSWIPGWRNRVPYPDQVAEVVVDGQSLVDEIVQRFAGLRSECSPPEPSAFSFVERTPEDGYAGCLEAEKLDCDGINIPDEESIIWTRGYECCGQVEGCGLS